MNSAVIGRVGVIVGMLAAGSAVAETKYSIAVKQSDFQSAETVRSLYERIQYQAKTACPSFWNARDISEIAQCRKEVAADLVEKINQPLLDAYLEGEDSLRIALAERRSGARS